MKTLPKGYKVSQPLEGMIDWVIYRNQVIACTEEGVFRLADDGSWERLKFVPLSDPLWVEYKP